MSDSVFRYCKRFCIYCNADECIENVDDKIEGRSKSGDLFLLIIVLFYLKQLYKKVSNTKQVGHFFIQCIFILLQTFSFALIVLLLQ